MIARAGPHVLIVVALLGGVLAFALCNGGSEKPAAPAERRPTVALPTASPVATVVDPEDVDGVPAVGTHLEPGQYLQTSRVYYIERMGFEGPLSLDRVYLDGAGAVHQEQLYPPIATTSSSLIASFGASTDGQRLAVIECASGGCAVPAYVAGDSHARLLVSSDGGMSWAKVADWAGTGEVLGLDGDLVYVQRVTRTPQNGLKAEYVSYPGGRVFGSADLASDTLVRQVGNSFVVSTDHRSFEQILGGGFMLPGLGPDAKIEDLKWSAGRPTLLSWVDTETQRYYLAAVSSTQALTHIVRIDSSVDAASLRDGVMVDDQHLVGTMLLPLGPALGDPARRETIVELDLATGAVVPLIQPEILTSLGAGELQVLAVMDRPFIRIAAQGDCLNVRTGSSTAMPTLGCYKDGVLLADRGRIARHNGDIWIAVTTPDGKDGWANGAFLDLAGHDLGPTPAVKVNTGLPEIDAIVAALSTGDMAQILPLVGFTPVACTVNPQGIGAPPQCPAGVPEGTPINVFPSGACEGYYILPDQLRFDPVGSMPLFAVVRWHPFIREGYSAPGDYEILFKNTSFNPPSTTSVFVGDGKIIRTAYGCGQPLDQALQGVAPEDILYRAP